MTNDEHEARRQAEMSRGRAVAARHFLARKFDPSYVAPDGWEERPRISAMERAQRDEYIRTLLPNGLVAPETEQPEGFE